MGMILLLVAMELFLIYTAWLASTKGRRGE